ncbi:hypothetical protein HMPREF1495_0101 [Lachnoanaerobaculum sp. MSX33]|nr:hypothetical protein HMPREF1495_0101 [Lachnoanaerobaculum sp. MSX33]
MAGRQNNALLYQGIKLINRFEEIKEIFNNVAHRYIKKKNNS